MCASCARAPHGDVDDATTAEDPASRDGDVLSAPSAQVEPPRAADDRLGTLRGAVTLTKAVALAKRDSPEEALVLVESLRAPLEDFHGFHVTRAELLRAVGRATEARIAYERAITLADNTAEIAHLTRRRDDLAAPSAPGESGRTPNGESR